MQLLVLCWLVGQELKTNYIINLSKCLHALDTLSTLIDRNLNYEIINCKEEIGVKILIRFFHLLDDELSSSREYFSDNLSIVIAGYYTIFWSLTICLLFTDCLQRFVLCSVERKADWWNFLYDQHERCALEISHVIYVR